MKIGFCGTMCVGKTTLVNALKELPEFKDYTFRTERSKYLRDLGIPLNTDSTLKGQTIFLAERATELMKKNIITDRTVIDVMAFSSKSKTIFPQEKKDFEKLASNLIREYDYIFYIPSKGIPIENNGVRTTDPIYRESIDLQIQQLLIKYSHNIGTLTELKGNTEERINQIKQTIFPPYL